MKTLLIITAVLLLQSPAFAGWKVTKSTDAMTDETTKRTYVTNGEGHTLMLYQIASGNVWANFAISKSSTDQLDPTRRIKLRIDKYEAHSINQYKWRSEWSPKWVNFRLWENNYKTNTVDSKIISELMEGKTVLVRYYLFTGGYKDTTFTLSASSAGIIEAIDMSPPMTEVRKAKLAKLSTLSPIDRFREEHADQLIISENDNMVVGKCATIAYSAADYNIDNFKLCIKNNQN